ncbi:Lipoyl synthase [compost metagenome]
MEDLRAVGVDILTLGQYLQPTPKHLPIVEFVEPERFQKYEKLGLEMGFRFVESGPLVRSSYHAEKHIFDL